MVMSRPPACGSALAVWFNAVANVIPHACAGHVRWKVALPFAATGMLGAFIGSSIGKAVNSQHLLVLFAVLMLVMATFMLRGRRGGADRYRLPHMYSRLGGIGLGTGSLSGFFGIGGGFLIVPGMMFASGMEIIYFIAVGAFGLTDATNYAVSDLIDWPIATQFIGGGIVGGWLGALGAKRLAPTRGSLNLIFALAIIIVAIFMLFKSLRG